MTGEVAPRFSRVRLLATPSLSECECRRAREVCSAAFASVFTACARAHVCVLCLCLSVVVDWIQCTRHAAERGVLLMSNERCTTISSRTNIFLFLHVVTVEQCMLPEAAWRFSTMARLLTTAHGEYIARRLARHAYIPTTNTYSAWPWRLCPCGTQAHASDEPQNNTVRFSLVLLSILLLLLCATHMHSSGAVVFADNSSATFNEGSFVGNSGSL